MTRKPIRKLYCYVDETGQDTQGGLFIVSVIIAEGDRGPLKDQLEQLERTAGKGQRKWMKAREEQRVAYIHGILAIPTLKGKLSYATYRNTTEYLPRTVLTAARAITAQADEPYKAVVFVDGLPRSQTRWFGAELRHLRVRTEKVRGVRKEESDALMRLADAVVGFVRAALSGNRQLQQLLERVREEGFIKEL